jgi:hypothetical protein
MLLTPLLDNKICNINKKDKIYKVVYYNCKSVYNGNAGPILPRFKRVRNKE